MGKHAYLKKKRLILSLILATTIVGAKPLQKHETNEVRKEQPQVLKAVAPTFIPFVYNEPGVVEFVIEVKINKEGQVITAKTISFSLFKDASLEETAKKWVFVKNSAREERVARIKFVMRIMSEDTILSELNTIYNYPAEIEIRHAIFKPQITEAPVFDKETPSQKKPKP